MPKTNPKTLIGNRMAEFCRLEEHAIVRTPDDWAPSLHADGRCNSHWHEDYNPSEMYVKVNLFPELIKSVEEEPKWQVSVWGGDDMYAAKTFVAYQEAKETFDLLVNTGLISMQDCVELGFGS